MFEAYLCIHVVIYVSFVVMRLIIV